MLIEIHAIQNHSPANLNRDDLGAPKTCYFGGVMRSRISSQCLKRSIRTSEQFKDLLGGVATRRLAQLIAGKGADAKQIDKAMSVLAICGIAPKGKKDGGDQGEIKDEKSAGRVYTTLHAVDEMRKVFKDGAKSDQEMAKEFVRLIAQDTAAPDMALCGRMLEPKKSKGVDVWKGCDLTVEAALQAAHAISTHEARPEVDYFVAADDIPGDDAGAAYVDEAMFASACFYKYFSIHWETLVSNLNKNNELAAHTVGAFLRGAALANPSGKQNSFAAHNPPDGMLIELRKTPISYANAFAAPVQCKGPRDIVSQSVAQLGQYAHDLDTGYGNPDKRFWFSPNLRYPLNYTEEKNEHSCTDSNFKSLDDLVVAVVKAVGFDWATVQAVTVK